MRLVRLVRGQHVNLLVAVHRVPQAQARAQFQIARLGHAFEQQDRILDAAVTQFDRLAEARHREPVGHAGQRPGHLQGAVPVSIGLDHRESAAARCGAAQDGEVAAQRGEVDACADAHGPRSGQRSTPSA